MSNELYEYKSDDNYGKVYIILPKPEKGFNVGYSLFIPKGCQIDTTMLVHCCNIGGAGVKDGKLDSSRRAIHLDEANEAAKISSLGGHLQYGYDLKIPVLTPLIPRIQGYYTQFLGSKVYHNDISDLKNDNEHRSEEDRLSDEEIKHIQEVCNNLPDQLAHIIVDSKDVLSKMGIHIDDKVIIEGYSAGSKFASGFTATHRELVKGCICGGNSGISILPVSEYDGEKLKFPLGIADVSDFDFKEFSRIPQYFYLGLSDYNDPALVNEQFQPLYSDCYTSEEVAFINNKLGSNVQERFDKLKDIYKQYGLNATFNKFVGDHKTVNNPDGPAYPMIKNFIMNIISREKSTIDLTPELIEIFNNIERDSKSSSSELIKYYSQFPEYQQMFKNIEIQSNNIKEQIRQLRLKNPQMSDNEFFEVFLNNYSKNIIDSIKKYYGDKLTPEIIERLNKFNISIINNPNAHGDMTAHPEKFQVEINVAHFGKDKKDIESKITLAMGTMPHEIFHFIFMMLKDENYCDERMVYNLSNGEQAHSFGMTGHMLNEGFVELLSSEFCRKNNIYYTISPSYIQFTKLCDYIMKTNPEINELFLMKNNYDGVLSTFSSDVLEKYKTTERMEYLRNFELETETGKKRKVEDSEVVSSYNERVKPKYMTSQVQYQQSNKQESFDQRSQNEIHTYRMIQRKNAEIKKQKRRKNKPKVLIRNLPTTSSQGNGNKGYINVIMISLITSFVLVALFVIIYIFIWR